MSDRTIIEAIQNIAGTQLTDKVWMIPCIVTAVDLSERTCDCTPVGGKAVTDIGGVQLMAEVDDGWLLVPAINSNVVVCYSERNIPYVALYSELQNATLIVAGKIQLQGGELGGMVTVTALTQKLNKLEQDLNTLKTAFSTWVPVPEDGGTALKAAASEWAGDTITETMRADIENTSITQGA